MLSYHKAANVSQKGFVDTRKPRQIKPTHVLLIQLKDSKMPSDQRFNMAKHSQRLRSLIYAFPGELHFHFAKLPAYLLFSDGRLGTLHFLKPPAFGRDTHTHPGAPPARTPRRQGWSAAVQRDPPRASPGNGCGQHSAACHQPRPAAVQWGGRKFWQVSAPLSTSKPQGLACVTLLNLCMITS